MTSCDECGFSYESLPVGEVAQAIVAFPARYRRAVEGKPPELVLRRPAPEVWSAFEYCCHVRDVFLVIRDRAVVALVEEAPTFKRMHRDERVVLCQYSAQPMGQVMDQLSMAAELCALVFERLGPQEWARPLDYYGRAQAPLQDLAWMGHHTVHEAEHHLGDVLRALTVPPKDGTGPPPRSK